MSETVPGELTKVILVSSPAIHEFFTDQYAGLWDTQEVVETLEDMWTMLSDGRLSSEETRIVIISDDTYDPDDPEQTFIRTLATFAPEAITFVIVSPNNTGVMPVVFERARHFIPDDEARRRAHIYPIGYQDPITDVDAALDHYQRLQASGFDIIDNVDEQAHHQNAETGNQIIGEIGSVDVSHNGIVIASTSSKGGSGKSSVGFLLASQIAQSSQKAYNEGKTERPLKVAIIDLDTRDGQLGFLIGDTSPTSLNIRLAPNWGPEVIQNNMIHDEKSGVHVLLAPKRVRTAEDTGPEFYEAVITNMRSMFDVIVLDTSVNYMDSLIYDVALPLSDMVLFVTNLGPTSVYGMARWFEEVTQPIDAHTPPVISRDKIGLVVNQVLPNVGMDQSKIVRAGMGAPLVAAIPAETQAFLLAANKNRLAEMLLHKNIGMQFYNLAEKIVKRVDPIGTHKLSPLFEEDGENNQTYRSAENNVAQPRKRSGLFRRGKAE